MVTLLAGLILGNTGLQLVNPQIVRTFIDTVQLGGTSAALLKSALLFTGLALVQQVVAILTAYVSENVSLTAINTLRTDLADHCLRLDMPFHNTHRPGEMIERIDGDTDALSSFFSQFVIQMLANAILLVGVLGLLFREDWRAGLALAGFSLIAMLILGRLRDVAVPYWESERQASADLFGFLEEGLSGTEDIRSSGAEAYAMYDLHRLLRVLMSKSRQAALMWNVLIVALHTFLALGTATAFAVGAYLFQRTTITIGTVYLIFHYTTMLERPITHITREIGNLQRAGASIVRIQKLFSTRSGIQGVEPDSAAVSLPKGPLMVEFQDVSFGYKGALAEHDPLEGDETEDKMVLQDLTFRLLPGTVLGLLGRTGSGKTSVARLLFRLYDPDAGQIRFGGVASPIEIHRVPLPSLRRQVGMVTQNVQLFHASVRDNLTFFDPSVPDEQILQMIRALGLWGWYQSLPEGLDTKLQSGGGGLSAGEAQLLAFTRIFLKDPGLVILDEASSRLDPATEHLIEHAIDKLVQNCTTIVIAHRLSTVQRADEIMILEDGRIREYGARTDLASDPNSHFYSLLQAGLEDVLV
jgi:ABC-type multidrug transport system fused ATPase/permease subunit